LVKGREWGPGLLLRLAVYCPELRNARNLRPPFPWSLFKILNFGVANAKILLCRLQKSPKIGIFAVYWPQKSTFKQALTL
jgi:hypothetical protein